MNYMNSSNGTLAREAQIDRRIDELIGKLVESGWTDQEAAEYHLVVGARTNSMRSRSRFTRRVTQPA